MVSYRRVAAPNHVPRTLSLSAVMGGSMLFTGPKVNPQPQTNNSMETVFFKTVPLGVNMNLCLSASCRKVMFSQTSVCPQGDGGEYPPQVFTSIHKTWVNMGERYASY